MGLYLVNFMAYTLAMIGIIFVCLMIYKKTMLNVGENKTPEYLKIENALNLSARKTIYVVKAGDEKFLIASDVDKTTFLAKLNDRKEESVEEKIASAIKKPTLSGISIDDELLSKSSNVRKLPVMKELVRKLNAQRG